MLINCVKVRNPSSTSSIFSLIASVGQTVGVGQLLVAETSSIKTWTLLMPPVNLWYESSVLLQFLFIWYQIFCSSIAAEDCSAYLGSMPQISLAYSAMVLSELNLPAQSSSSLSLSSCHHYHHYYHYHQNCSYRCWRCCGWPSRPSAPGPCTPRTPCPGCWCRPAQGEKYLSAAVKIFASDLVVREGEEAVVVQQHVDQVGELALVARGEEAVTDHVDNLHMFRSSVLLSRIKHSFIVPCVLIVS